MWVKPTPYTLRQERQQRRGPNAGAQTPPRDGGFSNLTHLPKLRALNHLPKLRAQAPKIPRVTAALVT